MARRRGASAGSGREPIDHAKLVDGFGDLADQTHYADRETRCGDCGARFLFTAAAQKYVLEVRRQPVKTLAYAAYCDSCRDTRAVVNRRTRAETDVQRLRAAALDDPDDLSAQLAYVAAHVRLLETGPSPPARTWGRLYADVRRIRRLAADPAQAAEAAAWEARLRQQRPPEQ